MISMSEIEQNSEAKKAPSPKKRDYDWLDDPFTEKDSAGERANAMTRGSKLAIGGGCLAIVAGIVLMAIVAFGMLGSLW